MTGSAESRRWPAGGDVGGERARDESLGATSRTRPVVSDVKTPRSRRTLFLTEPVTAALRRHPARQAACNEVGRPLDPDAFSHWFTRPCPDAGIRHWHPHNLRQWGASLMLAQGVPLHAASEVLGHASIAITKDVYGHLVEGDTRRAAESMSGFSGRLAPRMAPRRTASRAPTSPGPARNHVAASHR